MRLLPRLSLIVLTLAAAANLRALEFRLLSWDGEITDLHYKRGAETVPVAAYENLLSPPYTWTGTGPLVLSRETRQEGKTVRTTVATLPPAGDLTHAILLLAATDATRTAYTGIWMDDSPESRPPQTITYRNLSSSTVAIRLGADDFTVPPQSFRTQRTEATTQRMVLKVAAQTQSGWEIIASTSQSVRPGRRTLVLLRDGRPQPNGHKDLIDFLVFNDRPAPPTPAGSTP